MTYIGIDYSINSPAVCILHNNNFYYYNRYNKVRTSARSMLIIERLCDVQNVELIVINNKEQVNYSESEKLDYSLELSGCIMSFIETKIKELCINKDDVRIAIEGLSYGSKGNRLADIAGFQYILRNKIKDAGFIFKIFAPTTIKKFAGKGNLSKPELIKIFINQKDVENNYLRNELVDKGDYYIKNNEWYKSIDDLVDSYWIVKFLQFFEENLNH